jgi:hypothetical protein
MSLNPNSLTLSLPRTNGADTAQLLPRRRLKRTYYFVCHAEIRSLTYSAQKKFVLMLCTIANRLAKIGNRRIIYPEERGNFGDFP